MATETGDVWEFTVDSTLIVISDGDSARLPLYNPDLVWNPVTGEWVSDEDLIAAGGGRYKNRFVAIGHRTIYFGDL